jgi:hypothetical protein
MSIPVLKGIADSVVLAQMSGNPDFKLRELIRNTYQKLSDAGLLPKLKGLWVHALPTQADALRNWITPGIRDMTVVGSLTFTASQGFTGDGSSGLLSTGVTTTTFGAGQDDVALGAYVLTASAASAALIGAATATSRRAYLASFTSGALTARLSDTSDDTFTPARYTGMFTLSRTGSANYGAYLDDALVATVTRASAGVSQVISFLGTVDTVGTSYSTAKIAFSYVSAGLTATDIKNLRSIMVDYFLVCVGAVTPTVANLPDASAFKTYVDLPIYLSDLGGGAGHVRSNGTAFIRENILGETTISSDADFTLTNLLSATRILHTGTLTANRTATLATTYAVAGSSRLVTRTGSGAFTLSVGGLCNLLQNEWAEVVYDGSAWYLARRGQVDKTYQNLIIGAGIAAAGGAGLKLTSGTVLTAAEAGAIEYDGVNIYGTEDTTQGRGQIHVDHYFRLTAAGSAITTIANFFGANSNIPLVASAYYEIDLFLFFTKSASSAATLTLTNSAAPTSQNIDYEMSPVTGIVAPPGTATMLRGQLYNDATAALAIVTGSLTLSVNHYMRLKIFLRNGAGTSLKIQATSATGSLTPGIGSHWFAKRRSPNNIGSFAA